MLRSETISDLATALAKAQGQMINARKDSANPFFKSTYADLSSIVDAIKKPLSDNGIAYIQTTDTDDGVVIVETTLLHSSGEWLSSRLRMKPVKDDPQGIGSCITYARRYGLQAIVGIAADDDDGNAASGAGDAKQPKPAPIREQTKRSEQTQPPKPAAPAATQTPKAAPPTTATNDIPDWALKDIGSVMKWAAEQFHVQRKDMLAAHNVNDVSQIKDLRRFAEDIRGAYSQKAAVKGDVDSDDPNDALFGAQE